MKEISYQDAIRLSKPFFIDLRAPIEFEKDHIPGSVNIPLFDDEERSEIGKIYAIMGQDDAIVRGTEIAGGKLGEIVANIKKINDKDIVIYCFRGGMRSSSLASLLSSLGIPVYKLKTGYKGYRRYVSSRLDSIEIKPKVFVLQGLTGTGKTLILRRLKNSIDLEDMAGHRSSVFGGIGLHPNSQKMFESLLLSKIDKLNNSEYVIFEGESRKIGNLFIPDKILKLIHDSPKILIEATIQRRVEILLKEYTHKMDNDEIISITESLSDRLGRKDTDILIKLFRDGELFEFTRLLLLKYYDPLYRHSLEKMDFLETVVNAKTEDTCAIIEEIVHQNLNA
ncbi:MAG: tRNA 2-selenouridine(34) synthase MnmH [Spirochaetota bacterium]|nr:tRNA 2-selenouridine(34) synthase MnmH [Spirochaetota bacterium]